MKRHELTKHAKKIGGMLGGHRLARRLTRDIPRILMYHRFTEEPQRRRLQVRDFDTQLKYLAANFRIVSMRDLIRHIRVKGAPPPDTAVITIDDGHADFYELAYPLLQSYGFPATLYITSRFVNGEIWLWPDELEYTLFATRQKSIELSSLGRLRLASRRDRWMAWHAILDLCTRSKDEVRLHILNEAKRLCAVDTPPAPVDRYRSVTWSQVREMAANGVEIGAHTRTHPILSRLPLEALNSEIAGSKLEIEHGLGQEVLSFCYPNGSPADFNETVKAKVQLAGFQSAVSATFDDEDMSDHFNINRIPVSSNISDFKNKVFGIDYLAARLRS